MRKDNSLMASLFCPLVGLLILQTAYSKACISQELEFSEVVQVASGEFVVVRDKQAFFLEEVSKPPRAVDLPFEAKEVVRINGSKLLVVKGHVDEAALVNYQSKSVKPLPSLGKNNLLCCGSQIDGVVYLGYQPPLIIAKVIGPEGVIQPKPETMIISFTLEQIDTFMSSTKELEFSVRRLPQLNPFALRKILLIGDRQVYDVSQSFISVEQGQRIPKWKNSIVDVSEDVVRTVFMVRQE